MKDNYKEFDSTLTQINLVYLESFKIFLTFKEQIVLYYDNNNKNILNIPSDSDIERPKLGNSLMQITHSSKYSNQSLVMLGNIYNRDACIFLSNNNATKQVCESIFSSILTKGMEQAIVQMSIIITSCVDELKSLKENTTLNELYDRKNNYYNYETFVGEFMLESFLLTQKIFEVFRNDEKAYMFKYNKLILIIFCIIYLFLLIAMIYSIYKYKNIINSFFNFIGIIPAKFITDDDYLYKTILKLEKDFF